MPFNNIFGQQSVVNMLQMAICHKRCSHAYLFTGPESVGKKLTALAFAQTVNCHTLSASVKRRKPDVFDACGKCVSCKKIIHLNHPEVRVVEPEKTSVTIEQIRSIKHESIFKPVEAYNKVYIINNAHTMTPEAMNCFLKILEEPPADVIFILITHRHADLLPTVISRCQIVAFNRLLPGDVTKILQENYEITSSQSIFPSLLAKGNVNKAAAYCDDPVIKTRKDIFDLFVSLRKNTSLCINDAFMQSEELSKDKEKTRTFINLAVSWYRDQLLVRLSSHQSALDNQEFYSDLQEEAQSVTSEKIIYILELLMSMKGFLDRTINIRLALENLFVKVSEVYCA